MGESKRKALANQMFKDMTSATGPNNNDLHIALISDLSDGWKVFSGVVERTRFEQGTVEVDEFMTREGVPDDDGERRKELANTIADVILGTLELSDNVVSRIVSCLLTKMQSQEQIRNTAGYIIGIQDRGDDGIGLRLKICKTLVDYQMECEQSGIKALMDKAA